MKTRMQKTIIIFLLPAILLLSGCARHVEKNLETINIAFQNWVGYGPLYLADEKGFFEDEGIELLFVDEQLDSARGDAFKAGILDCEAGTIDLLITKKAQGVPVTSVLGLDISCGSDGIVACKKIKNVQGLIGKKIALARYDVGETFLAYVLQENGFSIGDVILVPERTDSAHIAFLEGEVDAVATWEPFLSGALQRPGSHILISTQDVSPIIIDTLNVREDLVKEKPEIIKGLMRAWFSALEYYRENPVESSKIISKYYGMTPAEYIRQTAGLQWVDYERHISEEDIAIKVFEAVSDIHIKAGRISEKPDVYNTLNTGLLKELYEDR